jgi:hypothetical protein
MKRCGNIKDSIMMPPPKARPKSRSDTSEELRRNLTESQPNNLDNQLLQEEIHKFFKENEEIEARKNEEEVSISKSNSSQNLDRLLNINKYNNQNLCSCNNLIANSQCANCSRKESKKNTFNFNLINYNYNYSQISDEEDNCVSLEKLKRNLITDKSFSGSNSKSLNNSLSNISNKNFKNFKNFCKLPPPKKKKEIKMFVNNMMKYISEHENDNILNILKIKIQTRDNDYKNKGLNFEYYQESLIKMQKELISRICTFCDEDKKINIGNYDMLNTKRNRSTEDTNEIDKNSDLSDNSCCSIRSPDSPKSIKFGKIIQ